jgi:CHAD domain-containing protein
MKKYPLSKNDTVHQAIVAILSSLTGLIDKNRPVSAASASDPETLHDYRVALRRTRCLVSQFRTVFHKRKIKHFRQEFAWLFSATSKVRDIDVHLDDLQYYKTLLPACLHNDLLILDNHLRVEQEKAYEEMLAVLASDRHKALSEDWQNYLADPELIRQQFANLAVFPVANASIQENYFALIKSGQSLQLGSADDSFHDLRKRCKKLRYLIDFFMPLYATDGIQPLVEGLKTLQDNLGRHQDVCVQMQFLQTLPVENKALSDCLLERLQTEKHKQQLEFKYHFFNFLSHKMPGSNAWVRFTSNHDRTL